jgi:RNA polymerase sigma-70 factor, ECF subfamily
VGTRTVFMLHDMEGFTHEEISAQLGVAIGTSKSQLSRAREKLRVALAPFAPRVTA